MKRSVQSDPATHVAGSHADEWTRLPVLSFDELRARFRRLYRRPAPEGLSRDLVARLVAHRIQERAIGGLAPELVRHLGRLSHGKSERRIKTGSVLVREHDGAMHEVVVVPTGFLWNGEVFASLSTIAKRITGTSWNGPRFFGLRAADRRKAGCAASAAAGAAPNA